LSEEINELTEQSPQRVKSDLGYRGGDDKGERFRGREGTSGTTVQEGSLFSMSFLDKQRKNH